MTEEELQALIAIAKQPAPKGEGFKDLDSVNAWILAASVTTGEARITPMKAYVAYYRWAKTPVGQTMFYKMFKKKFKRVRATRTKDGVQAFYVYLLNEEPFSNLPNSFDELREYLSNLNRQEHEQKK